MAELSADEQRERDAFVLPELDTVRVDDDAEYGGDDTITEREHEAFSDMREALRKFTVLTDKQRAWALQVAARVGVNPVPPKYRPPIPRGEEVELAPVLRNLPKSPPGRRRA